MALASVLTPQLFQHGHFGSSLAHEAYVGELSELRLQASWLSHLVDTMPAGVVVLDGQGMIAKANQIASDMLGEPLEGEKWFSIIQRSFRPQQDDGHEVSLRDGRRIKLEIRALAPEPGQLILMTDLTETRQLQTRLAHMQRLSALGKMVATLAHQVRTPLSAAMLYGANLGSERLNSESRAHFHGKLMSRLKDLESQVNDMLLFAKSGEQQVIEPMSLGQLLSEVKHGADAMLSENTAQLHVQLPEPDVEVMGNRTALASAINNLIHNSLQVIEEDAHIHLSAARCSEDGIRNLRVGHQHIGCVFREIDHHRPADTNIQDAARCPLAGGDMDLAREVAFRLGCRSRHAHQSSEQNSRGSQLVKIVFHRAPLAGRSVFNRAHCAPAWLVTPYFT